MPPQRPLTAIVYIQHEPTRIRCLQYLSDLHVSSQLAVRLPRHVLQVQQCNSAEEAARQLHLHFKATAINPAVFISDELAETTGRFPDERAFPKNWAKEAILDPFENRLLGTLAIMDRFRRVPDIDRVLWQNFDAEALLNALGLVADKLAYITPPDRTSAGLQTGPVIVRPIKDKTELRNYFLLRHRVYRIMGYLKPWADSALSEMEINSCDTHALHVGAFVREGAGEKLIGTARVVSQDPLDDRYERWTRSLAASDPVLNTHIDTYDPLRLPVFESMHLNEKIIESLTMAQNCGELSRVIVTEDYRGQGISELLIWFAVLQAAHKGVGQLLLECLPLHERLYRKFGFARMQGVTGQVIGVDKTMIAMELTPMALAQVHQQPSVCRFVKAIRDLGCLQTCHAEQCGQAGCDLYMVGKCPPR